MNDYPPEWDEPAIDNPEEWTDCTANTIGCDESDLELKGDIHDPWFTLTLPNQTVIEYDDCGEQSVDQAFHTWQNYEGTRIDMLRSKDLSPTRLHAGYAAGRIAFSVCCRIIAEQVSDRTNDTKAVY